MWDDCDDSLFSQICDIDEVEKVDIGVHIQTNSEINSCLLSKKTENCIKRKYCVTESESNEPVQTNSEIYSSLFPKNAENYTKRKYYSTESREPKDELKKNMLKKLKHNSLFK